MRNGQNHIQMQPLHDERPTVPSQRQTIYDRGLLSSLTHVLNNMVPTSAATFLAISFAIFGTLNNSLYVVILTAALELIPTGTPTGIVAVANIAPALIAKAVWPYVLKGDVRYTRRIWSCVALNLIGLLTIALLPALWTRLLGISIASFSSGLGELTFLQLSTRYGRQGAGRSVGWFSSGTGAAGLVGAAAWWIVRPLGVRGGLLTLTFMPLLMAFAYSTILPTIESVETELGSGKGGYEHVRGEEYDIRESNDEDRTPPASPPPPESTAVLAVSPHTSLFDDGISMHSKDINSVTLTFADKMQLIKPMLFVYIVPLVSVYFFEYTINQGVAPTLLYPLPTPSNHPLLAMIIKRLKDYYPLYQLTYQTFVFLSRSSISLFRLPAIPKQYLWVPAFLQGSLLLLLVSESIYHWFRESIASPLVIVFVCVEGLAGGSAYVSVFYQIGTEDHIEEAEVVGGEDGIEDVGSKATRQAQEHEFRIGCVGVGDTMGILLAALISIPLEISLCNAQVRRGRLLCKQV